MIDTHAHLGDDATEVLQRARAAGVDRVVAVATTVLEASGVLAVAEREPGVYACLGVHPHNAGAPNDLDVQRGVRRQSSASYASALALSGFVSSDWSSLLALRNSVRL